MTDLRHDLRRFADAVGHPLEPWQAEALSVHARPQRETAVVGPRRSGKSRAAALAALRHCFGGAERHALVVSSTELGARRFTDTARRIALGSPLLAPSLVEGESQAQLLVFSNGSTLRSVAATEAAVRGWTASLVIVDEAALVSDDVVLGGLRPIIASEPDGRLLMISSALRAGGAFYDAVVRGEAGSEHVAVFRWGLADCHWISPTEVEAAREALSPERFAAEYEGIFASGRDALFSPAQLDRVTADYFPLALPELLPYARLLGGVDWGATTDRSAVVAVGRLPVPGERVYGVATAHAWPSGYPMHATVDELAACPAHWDALVAERNGLGAPLAADLFRKLAARPPEAGGATARRVRVLEERAGPGGESTFVDPVTGRRPTPRPRAGGGFTTRRVAAHVDAAMKGVAYSTLRLLIDRERLLLPAAAEELRRELLTLRVDLAPFGEKIEASSGFDDLADALALSTVPYRARKGEWSTLLLDLSRRPPPPDVDVPVRASRRTVRTPGGLVIPREPAWASVNGPELTLPPGAAEDPRRSRDADLRRRVHERRRIHERREEIDSAA